MKHLLGSLLAGFLILASAGPAEKSEASGVATPGDADLDALVKTWSDARFWILSKGRRTGWQRYQLRWGEYAGEKAIVVDYERATYLFAADRFTAWLRPDATLSPRAVRWGNTYHTLEIDQGKIDPRSPFSVKDPGSLALFPLLLTSLVPLKEGTELAFNLLQPHASQASPGQMKVLGMEASPGAKGGPAWKVQVTSEVKRFDDPETWETVFWVKADRTLVRAQTKIAYTLSFSGEKRQVAEECVPADPKEWADESLAANEMWAHAGLCLLSDMNMVLRAHDAEENNANDYWTGDVSGFFRLIPPKKKDPISLIPREIAQADAAPLPAGPEKGGAAMADPLGPKPVPWHGYYFKVLSKGREEGKPAALNEGSNHHPYMFGICAYPAEYGKTGKKTFLATEMMDSYWKDLKGQPVAEAPADLAKDGWQWDGPRR